MQQLIKITRIFHNDNDVGDVDDNDDDGDDDDDVIIIFCCSIACPAWCQHPIGDLGLDPYKHAQAHHHTSIIIIIIIISISALTSSHQHNHIQIFKECPEVNTGLMQNMNQLGFTPWENLNILGSLF